MEDVPRIISFREMLKITPEELLEERVLQRDIHYSVECSSYNPYPEIVLNKDGFYEKNRGFRIKDRNLYFFGDIWPEDNLPYYLRESDIISSGFGSFDRSNIRPRKGAEIYKVEPDEEVLDETILFLAGAVVIPFNKPLRRVDDLGGLPELYNTRVGKWEPYTHKAYKPAPKEKLTNWTFRLKQSIMG